MKPEEITPLAVLFAVSLFLLKEIWGFFKHKEDSHESKTDKLVDAIQQNTIAITTLTVRMEYLERKLQALPSLEKDVSALGQKVRDMTQR